MSHFNTIYNQLLHLIPRHQFEVLVKRYDGNYYVKYFTCWQQFMCYYLLLSYIKHQTEYSYSLLELSRIFSEMIFERVSLIDLLSCTY